MFRLFIIVLAGIAAASAQCRSYYVRGMSSNGINDVVNRHNDYRLQIAKGSLRGQPKGYNLQRLYYDYTLGQKAEVVSNTCRMDHITITDDRFNFVGQNLYLERSSVYNTYQNWNGAVDSWFGEQSNYNYYSNSASGVVGHYTQVVWAETSRIGCDFILFYDYSYPDHPYTKLYTCNYGEGGNVNRRRPYLASGEYKCPNLC